MANDLNPNSPETKVPALPAPQSQQQLLQALKELVEVREGIRGNPLDQNVTWRELVKSGVANIVINGQEIGGSDPTFPLQPPAGSNDLTPPPQPVGLAATGAIQNVILSWNDPGNLNIAYTEIWRSSTTTAPDAAGTAAVLVGTTEAYLYADDVGLSNATRYYWVRFRSTADVPGPFSARVTGSTALVGGVDLSDAVITSQKIANGAISAHEAFGGSLRPVASGATLPTLPDTAKYAAGALFFLTTDSKLYRSTGTTWVVNVPAGDITGQLTNAQIADLAATKVTGQITTTQISDNAISTPKIAAGAVVAGSIAAGTITGDRIAANTITATRLLVGSKASVHPDPQFYDPTFWANAASWPAVFSPSSGSTYPTPSSRALKIVPTGAATDIFTGWFPVERGAAYRTRVWIYLENAVGEFALKIHWPWVAWDTMGIPSSGSMSFDAAQSKWDFATIGQNVWKVYDNQFINPDTVVNSNANREAQFRLMSNLSSGAIYIGIELVRAASADLIVDGAISAAKIQAGTITGDRIAAGTIAASNIATGTITADRIATATITAASGVIANAAITNAAIANLAVDAAKIADLTIVEGKIADAAITNAKIGNAAITDAKIAAATITTASIANAAITGAKIANATITAANITDATITGAKIGSATITGANIGSATIGGANIASATITGANIASATIGGANIQIATITGANIANATIGAANIGSVNADTITAGTLSAARIAAGTITGTMIAGSTIQAGNIAAGTITATQIAAGTITANRIAAGTITANEIADTTITGSKIVNGTITGTQIAGSTITGSNIAGSTITGGNIAGTTITAANISDSTITSAKIAGTIQSDNWGSSSGWQINRAGTATFNQVAVRGQINTGSYIGYAWPTAGSVGSHMSEFGLLLGNGTGTGGNARGFFQFDVATGQLFIGRGEVVKLGLDSAGNLTITGSLTAGAVNAVNTVNVTPRAVTFPISTTGTANANGGPAVTVIDALASERILLIAYFEPTTSTVTGTATNYLRYSNADVLQADTQYGVASDGGGGTIYSFSGQTVITVYTPGSAGNAGFYINSSLSRGAILYAVQTKR